MSDEVENAGLWRAPPKAVALPPQTVQVWLASITSAAPVIDPLVALLSEDERDRFNGFRKADDRRRGVLGRGMARGLLARYLDAAPAELVFKKNPQGKPQLAGTHQSSGIEFSIAHSGDLVLAAFARGAELGVDVEAIDRAADHEKLARRFFAPEESEALMTLLPADRPAAFMRAWTRKEAYIKARGLGLSIPLDSFHVPLLPGAPCAITWVRDAPGEAAQWQLCDLQPDARHAAALAVRAAEWPVACWDLRGREAGLIPGAESGARAAD